MRKAKLPFCTSTRRDSLVGFKSGRSHKLIRVFPGPRLTWLGNSRVRSWFLKYRCCSTRLTPRALAGRFANAETVHHMTLTYPCNAICGNSHCEVLDRRNMVRREADLERNAML